MLFKLHDKIYKEVLAYAKECQSSSKRQLDNLVHKDDVEDFSNQAVENIEVLDKKVETLTDTSPGEPIENPLEDMPSQM